MASPVEIEERRLIEPGYEIVDGVCVEKDMGTRSDYFAARIDRRLGPFVEDHGLGLVFTQGAGFEYAELDGGKLKFADVAFVPAARFNDGEVPGGWMSVPPDLVVEVVSPNDDAGKVNRKARLWLNGGVRLVWVVYPETHEVHVFRSDGTAAVRLDGDTLSGEDVVPGFSVPVAEIFAIPGVGSKS
jgi:Uma2 family endonuclease